MPDFGGMTSKQVAKQTAADAARCSPKCYACDHRATGSRAETGMGPNQPACERHQDGLEAA